MDKKSRKRPKHIVFSESKVSTDEPFKYNKGKRTKCSKCGKFHDFKGTLQTHIRL